MWKICFVVAILAGLSGCNSVFTESPAGQAVIDGPDHLDKWPFFGENFSPNEKCSRAFVVWIRGFHGPGSSMEDTEIFLDGAFQGKSDIGFGCVIDRMKTAPIGSAFVFLWDAPLMNESSSTGINAPFWYFIHDHLYLRSLGDDLVKTVSRRKIVLIYPYPKFGTRDTDRDR
jgi:hypothetical protein